jgi:hypothetical protein
MKYENLQQLAALFKARVDETSAGHNNVTKAVSSINDALTILHRTLKQNGELETALRRGGYILGPDQDAAHRDADGLSLTDKLSSVTTTYIKEVEKLMLEVEIMLHSGS